MATVIASDAKLVVNLDTTDAEAKAAKLAAKLAAMLPGGGIGPGGGPRPSQPRPPAQPRQPRQTNPARPGAGQGAGEGGDEFDALEHAKAVAKAAASGNLYGQALETGAAALAAIPGGGAPAAAGLKFVQLQQRYGIATSAALDALADGIPDPALRATVKSLTTKFSEVSQSVAAGLNALEVRLNAMGQTLDDLKETATAGGALGGLDVNEVEAYGSRMYDVHRFFGELDKARTMRRDLWLGQALGSEGRNVIGRMFGGGSGR